MTTKTKTRDEEKTTKVGIRLDSGLMKRIHAVRDRLPKVVPGTRTGETAIIQSILLGETTLAELEKLCARGSR